MRTFKAIVLCFVVLAGTAWAADKASPKPKTNDNSARVLDALSTEEKQMWDAWTNKTPDPLQKMIADDGVTVSIAGSQGKAEFIKDVATGVCAVKSYELKNLKVTSFSPTVALLTYKAEQQASCGGQALPAAVYGSSVYMHRGGKWLVVFHQETPAMQ